MYKKTFCPIDGNEPSNRCVHETIRFAKDQRAELCFFHIVDNSNSRPAWDQSSADE